MQISPFSSREVLNQRHRLSHQQIDDLLKENYAGKHLSEKFGQLFQVGEFIKFSDEFRKAAVRFIPLKGPILSYRLHKDPSYRNSNDLDFLIDEKAVEKAIAILEKNGYKSHHFPWPANPEKKRRLIKLSNQILFIHPEKQINIEIHWKLFKFEITNSEILSEVLRSNEQQIQFKERNFTVFNNELELLYLVIHGGLHAWFRLKWLFDVKDFIEKAPFDPEKFNQLVVQLNASRMVSLCNALLTKYFPGCPVLPSGSVSAPNIRFSYTVSQIEVEECYNKTFLEKINGYWFKLLCFPGFRYKISNIYSGLLRQVFKAFKFYPTSL